MRYTTQFDVTIIVLSKRIDWSIVRHGDKVVCKPNRIMSKNFFLSYCFSQIDLSEFSNLHCVDRFVLGHVITSAVISEDAKITTGIYHSKEMLWQPSAYYARLQSTMFYELFSKNIYFGNDVVKKVYEDLYQANVAKDSVFPIGIKFLESKKTTKLSYHIAIIGRHTGFKAYIGAFLAEWQRTNFDMEMPLKITVIGEGPLTKKLKSDYPEAHFVGKMQPSEIERVLAHTDLVLCGGTTAPLIASTGTTVLVGIENEADKYANGFFHEIYSEAYNSKTSNNNRVSFHTAIHHFYGELSKNSNLIHKNIRAAAPYDIEVTHLKMQEFLKNSVKTKYHSSFPQYLRYKISLIFWLTYEIVFNKKIIRKRLM